MVAAVVLKRGAIARPSGALESDLPSGDASKSPSGQTNALIFCERLRRAAPRELGDLALDLLECRPVPGDAGKLLVQRIETICSSPRDGDKPQKINLENWAKLVYALSFLQPRATHCFEMARQRLAEGISVLDNEAVRKVAFAFARANAPSEGVFSAIAKVIDDRDKTDDRPTLAQISDIALSFGQMRVPPSAIIERAFAHALQANSVATLTDCAQLAIGATMLDHPLAARLTARSLEYSVYEFGKLSGYLARDLNLCCLAHGIAPTEALTARRNATFSYLKRPEINGFERDVAGHLNAELSAEEGFTVLPQATVHGTYVDILVSFNDHRGEQYFVIECDGVRYHQVGGQYHDLVRGDDYLKTRALEACGYSVIHMTDQEWEMASSFADHVRQLAEEGERIMAPGDAVPTEKSYSRSFR